MRTGSYGGCDIVSQSNNETAMTEFWQHRVGLDCEEILGVFKGVNQHRYTLRCAPTCSSCIQSPLPFEFKSTIPA
jgi:hypothetical protein